MKTQIIFITAFLFTLTGGVDAQTKDPMQHMDHSKMQHMQMKPEPAKPVKKVVTAKKTTGKKKPVSKQVKKTTTKKIVAKPATKKAMAPDHSMHMMDMKMNHQVQDSASPHPADHSMHGMNMAAPRSDSAVMPAHTMHDMQNMPVHDTVKPGAKPADHSMHNMNMPGMKDSTKTDTMTMDHGSMNMNMHDMEMGAMDGMSHSYSLHLPMARNGSGTGWLPDASPMYGRMIHSRNWMYMLHGSLWLRYDNQDYGHKGSRGDARVDAPNWFMFMGQRKVGRHGLFHFSSMFSLDAVTEGGRGYPLLFQTGESYNGMALVDRQHPHDLFSELSVGYSHAFSKKTDLFLYVGYPGEPALGPVTFMHRPSALDNPNSPISHHWVDATHISFGVATLGLRLGQWKLEASSFTGREPDENRYNFDKPRFDSWSGRLSFNPSRNWAVQVSHGYVKSPEELHPDENIYKTTASIIYSSDMLHGGQFNITGLWGMNKQEGHAGENAVLLEGAWRKNKNALYMRYEWTQKSAEELVLSSIFPAHTIFPVHTFTLGDNFDLLELGKMRVAVGGQWSINHAPGSLDGIYGRSPMGFQLYIRIYPSLMKI